MRKIAAGLERAFAENGFAEPSVEDLRDAAGVSLRTLYKYMPSRDAMVRAALDNRHRRYMALIFTNLPDTPDIALAAIIDRTGDWMKQEASHGCLFHAAVAAAPHDKALRALLERHKGEVARQAVQASQLPGQEAVLTLVIEGLTQSWPLYKEEAIASAKRLAAAMTKQ